MNGTRAKPTGARTQAAVSPTQGAAAIVVVPLEQLDALIRDAVAAELADRREDVRPALLDRKGIAQALGIGTTSVDRFRKDGMPFIWLGESPRYIVEECIAWLRENQRGRVSAGEAEDCEATVLSTRRACASHHGVPGSS